MFGGMIGAGFAIAEGRFLDYAKQHGLGAFAALFFFGSVFGLASALLHVPQPDCPLPGAEAKTPYLETVRRTFRNKPFVALAMVHAVTALSGIAGPFWTVYLLRDVGVSFFGMGVLNCIGTVAAVASAPLWGRAVGKFGCRPVIIISLLVLVPASFFWMPVGPGDVDAAYRWVPWANLLGAIGGSGLGVSISTFVYKASYPEGRSIQFAMYNTFVTLVGAPTPLVGGALVSWLAGMGLAIDLRLTFLAWSGCMAVAFVFARKLVEPEATSTRTLIFDRMPSWVGTRFAASVAVPMGLVGGVLGKIQQIGGETNGKDHTDAKPDGTDAPGATAA
jgi:MFS family permease